jgi:L-lysine 2,3-aminomutase
MSGFSSYWRLMGHYKILDRRIDIVSIENIARLVPEINRTITMGYNSLRRWGRQLVPIVRQVLPDQMNIRPGCGPKHKNAGPI